MKHISPVILLSLLSLMVVAGEAPEEKRWWEKRADQRPALYFPHNAHDQAMEESGVLCLACHPFSKTDETDPEAVGEMSAVANEPLEAICHSCHVEDRSAPTECRLCHPDPKKIWPRDHDLDYVRLHGPDALEDERACSSCHLDLNYCVDCHFRRDAASHREHGLGYRLSHGLDARMDPQKCSSCHNPSYCFDCHREIGP
ncbi:hypothetical protein [Thiolapillus sp.]